LDVDCAVTPSYKRTFWFPSSRDFRTLRSLANQEGVEQASWNRPQQSHVINRASGIGRSGPSEASDIQLLTVDRLAPKIGVPNYRMPKDPGRSSPITFTWARLSERGRKQGLPYKKTVVPSTIDRQLDQTRSNDPTVPIRQGTNDVMNQRPARTTTTQVKPGTANLSDIGAQEPLWSGDPTIRNPSIASPARPTPKAAGPPPSEAAEGGRAFEKTFNLGSFGANIATSNPPNGSKTATAREFEPPRTTMIVPIVRSNIVGLGIGTGRGTPLSSGGRSGGPSDANKGVSYGVDLALGDEGTDSNSLSAVAGELWLDTLLLRNWLQTYLSTEMKHASRDRDEIENTT
jgi:hypothetical protein